ncbi:MAG: TlpA family protein disulfide reductase [Bacteroidota bacterium]
MKKLLLALLICSGLFASNVANAQLPAGNIAPNFTGTDLNGNTWDLYSILDAGKTVFIDVSATWCGPCWSYHTSGRLESLYNTYGPPGTDEIMVFFIEGDATTTLADLQGTGSNTQGDWISGTPYPIIDDASIGNLLDISYFPTIYMVCPDRIIKEVGQLTSVAAFMTQKNANCYSATEVNDAGVTNSMTVLNGTLASCNPVDVSYRLCNYGTSPLTSATINLDLGGTPSGSFNWTGSLNTYESTVLTFNGVNPTTTGTVVATVTTADANGSPDVVTANNSRSVNVIKFSSVGTSLSPQNFSVTTFPPANWLQLTPTTGAIFLRSAAGNGNAGSAKMDFWTASNGNTDVLQLPQLDLTAISNPIMTFDISHARYQTSNDAVRVKVSTNCGLTWMTLYNKAGQVNNICTY